VPTIVGVERIQNRSLYAHYYMTKRMLQEDKQLDEALLGMKHGSKTNAYDNIIAEGFDISRQTREGLPLARVHLLFDGNYHTDSRRFPAPNYVILKVTSFKCLFAMSYSTGLHVAIKI
jgi:hypothetical protein